MLMYSILIVMVLILNYVLKSVIVCQHHLNQFVVKMDSLTSLLAGLAALLLLMME